VTIRDTPPVTAWWWKFLLAGPCLVALVIVAAGVGVNAWYLGMFTVLAAFVSTAMGVVLLLARLFSHRVSERAT
jgi:fatty-acid desaturase